MVRKLILPVVVLAALATAPAALARTSSATAGGVTATLGYSGRAPLLTAQKLTISRDGHTLYSRAVSSQSCGHRCGVVSGAEAPPLQVVDLQGNGAPEVLLDLFTGGAHCCSVAQVFSYDSSARTYHESEHNFGDPGYRLARLGGRREFLSADDAFAYTFTDFADSALPIQIIGWRNGRFVDDTRAYPSLIAADGARWLKLYKGVAGRRRADTVGPIAAWAADEYLLGHVAAAQRYLDQQAAAGHLTVAPGGIGVGGHAFVTKLESFLRKQGYLRSR